MDQLLSNTEIAIAIKTIEDVVGAYKMALMAIASDTYLERMDAKDMWRQHKALLGFYGRKVFSEGMIQGGANPADMDEAEKKYLLAWIADQKTYTQAFARWVEDIPAGADGLGQLQELNTRIDLWAGNLAALGSAAFAFARKNQSGTWHLGATEEHCETCAKLNGKTRRLKWFLENGYIPRERGSGTLECGGWNCDCYITAQNGEWLLPA